MTLSREQNADQLSTEAAVGALVDPGWIAQNLDDPDVRLIEVDVSSASYDTGHIPGAILWNAYSDLRRSDVSPIDSRAFADLLSRSGISPASTIVFYGYGAHLGFWLMKRYRHEQVLLMVGPRGRWERAGLRWSRKEPSVSRASYTLPSEDLTVAVSREAVGKLLSRPGVVIVDVRSRAEFTGERFWPSGATEDVGRAGHIPGAAHIPVELVRTEEGALKRPGELRALHEVNGVEPDRQVVTYCTIGNRASQVWFALKYLLGYPDMSVYYGSWVEWGKLSSTPIEI